jgi:hypothetical protein
MSKLKLTTNEIDQIKELIYNKIDMVNGYENLDDSLKIILKKLTNKIILKKLTD